MEFLKMLINVCIIEAGGVVGATPQKYKLSIYCSTPEAMAYLLFSYQNLNFRAHLKMWLPLQKLSLMAHLIFWEILFWNNEATVVLFY